MLNAPVLKETAVRAFLNVDRDNLTIMGVPFPDVETFNTAVRAVYPGMIEGDLNPTAKKIELMRDYFLGIISLDKYIELLTVSRHEQKI
ncbi:MAG: hypothetical protein LBT40_15360 [Deltaproteobacteria bacterium]|jgi:hypothetical protein|nr:hypothetical protein [Deltaproteobacteria bacterium]